MNDRVPVVKDDERELPIPSSWRSILRSIADALAAHNYRLIGIAGVESLDDSTADWIEKQIQDYGCTLTSLPDATWKTSIYQWDNDHWELLVDLFTREEGASDLVMHIRADEADGCFTFKLGSVHVP